ncbi:MAG: hypothetical protein ACW98Y_21240 [Candidatus Thorarchaeota archaeon]|jgi:hypothetical protein
MVSLSPIEYYYESVLNASYSSRRMLIIRTVKENSTHYQFQEFNRALQVKDAFVIDRGISVSHEDTFDTFWSISHDEADMIRIRFSFLDAPVDAQMIIIDSRGAVVADMRGRYDFNVWSPWVSGNTIRVELVPTAIGGDGGIGNYTFTIREYQTADVEIVNDSSTTSVSDTSSSTTESQFLSDTVFRFSIGLGSALGVMFIAIIIILRKPVR